jgi:UDP-GlcNAc:undecaprenyl-phosphate GlcNAc-1-phosphate transferase
VTVRRVLRRRSPVAADRAHIHHLLQRCGLSGPGTWTLLIAANALLGAIGAFGWRAGVSEPVLFAAYLALGAVYFAVFVKSGWLIRRCRRAASH